MEEQKESDLVRGAEREFMRIKLKLHETKISIFQQFNDCSQKTQIQLIQLESLYSKLHNGEYFLNLQIFDLMLELVDNYQQHQS